MHPAGLRCSSDRLQSAVAICRTVMIGDADHSGAAKTSGPVSQQQQAPLLTPPAGALQPAGALAASRGGAGSAAGRYRALKPCFFQ